jgi:flagellar hook-associated protein 1 FlgK
MAGNTLRADQIAMQVVGQNIANANTDGYIREDVILSPGPSQQLGGLLLGMGVEVRGVIQKIDNFLEDRLRSAVSDRSAGETREDSYIQLETTINELGDTDLSTSMTKFFSSISEVLNQPESTSVRNLAMLQGRTLAGDLQRLGRRVAEVRNSMDDKIWDMAERINNLSEEIRSLNIRIAAAEGGDVSASDAVGLRDQRLKALESLAELIDIRVEEQTSGGVAVYTGGDFLVYEGTVREVKAVQDSEGGLPSSEVRLVETDAAIAPEGGELGGLLDARDNILGDFITRLNDFTRSLVFEFNKVYAGGQGLSGYQETTSEFGVNDANAALNSEEAGLPYTPKNGSFQLLVHNKKTGVTQTKNILVDLNGIDHETTLNDLETALTANGVVAEANTEGKLELRTESADNEFAFANDTSGVLAALGINTFFSGTSVWDVGVSATVQDDPGKFAASRGGIGEDTDNAIVLADLADQTIEGENGISLAVMYDQLMSETTQGSTVARATAEGTRVFEQTLRGQKLSTSGVSLDEEAIRLMGYQRSYQASARFIKTLEDLFDNLLSI